MQFKAPKTAADHSSIRNRNEEEAAPLASEVDFDVFGAKEIRDVLKSKAHCLRAGFSPNHIIIEILNEIRDSYILRVGLPTYLSQMLGSIGNAPIQDCTLYTENGRSIKLQLNGNFKQPIQRFVARHFKDSNLPFRVEIHNSNRVEVRYL
jgi:hypothetical protein